MFDYVIVGSGYAGSVMANKIATVLNKKVLIIEKRKHIGGNCYDFKDDNNILVHKYGPHLFHTNNKEVFDYLSEFTKWDIYSHKVLAYVDGKTINIPFNINSIYDSFPEELAKKITNKLLKKFPYNTKIPILELKKIKDKDLGFLADFIYEKIFVNYTSKQWDMKPESLDSAVSARVPVFVGKDDRYFNDKYQAMPREGYTRIFEKMLDHKNIKIMLNTDFKEVCKIGKDVHYLFDSEFKGKIIYTGAIDELFDYKFGDLSYRGIDMVFETVDKEYYQKAATVNYPNDYDFTRITEFKYIHPVNSDKTTILKEYPKAYKKGKDTPYYPVFTKNSQANYDEYLDYSKQYQNIILLGRLAEYKYYDMDDVVERALQVFQTL